MKKLYFFITVFAVCTLLSSCKKESESVVFYWDETGCADPWEQRSDDTEGDRKMAIESYLVEENVDIQCVEFEFDATKQQFCEACNCLTGRVVKVRVIEEDRGRMEVLNFYQ